MAREVLFAVREYARTWGLPAAFLQAVVDAEGGRDAIIRAVQCSVPSVTTLNKALEVTCRTITHALSDWVLQDKGDGREPRDFIDFLGARWAPQGAANDPTNLNANWVRNVAAIYQELTRA